MLENVCWMVVVQPKIQNEFVTYIRTFYLHRTRETSRKHTYNTGVVYDTIIVCRCENYNKNRKMYNVPRL